MNNDLFEVPPSLSPYQAFLLRHNPHVYESAVQGVENPFTAYLDGQFAEAIEGVIDPEILGYGATEKEAVMDLAIKQQLEGFDTFDWEI